jgi:hypothetical protein
MSMNGRTIASFFFSLIVVGVLIAIGVGIYQAGVTQGVIDAGRFPAGAAVPVAGYDGYHGGGFGFLGLLFPLLFLFLIFGLVRAAFSRGRGWGHGYGHGYGWDKGQGGPMSWREDRERTIADMHRRLHEADGSAGSTDSGTGSPGSPGGTGGPAAR